MIRFYRFYIYVCLDWLVINLDEKERESVYVCIFVLRGVSGGVYINGGVIIFCDCEGVDFSGC